MKQDKIFMILIITLILLINSSLISCSIHDILEGKDNRYFQSQNGNKNELMNLNSFDTEIFNPVNAKMNEIYWIPFTSAIPKDSNILPKSRDTIGFCIDTDFFGMNMMKRVIDSVDYQQITVPLCGFISEVGNPALPQRTHPPGRIPQRRGRYRLLFRMAQKPVSRPVRTNESPVRAECPRAGTERC